MRVLLGALIGAIIVFIFSAVMHMATPLVTAKQLPNEDVVLDALRANVKESAVYFFPGINMEKGRPSDEEQKVWEDKYRRGPSGLMIYTASGMEPAFPKQLGLEFLAVFLSCAVAAFVLARTRGSYLARAVTVALFALFAFLSISASHWIWYNFPSAFVLAELLIEFVAYLLAGLAIAKIVPAPAP